jgi:hypothetical protein
MPRKLFCGEQSYFFNNSSSGRAALVILVLSFCLAATRAFTFTPMRPAIQICRQRTFRTAHHRLSAAASTHTAFFRPTCTRHRRFIHQEVLPPLHSAIPHIMAIDSENNKFTPYERWVRRLYQTNLFHPVKLGLQNMEELHAMLGRPMDNVSPFSPAQTPSR